MAIVNRVELTDEQKKAVLKAFLSSDKYMELFNEFQKSFKVMEERKAPHGDYYVVWSALLNRTVQFPVSQVIDRTEPAGVDSLNLSVRTHNALRRAGVDSISDLLIRWPEDIKKIRNMGMRTYNEIGNRLLDAGLIESYEAMGKEGSK